MEDKSFRSTRIQLTVFYLAIIMMVSIFFSLIVFRTSAVEMERGMRSQAIRILPRTQFYPLLPSDLVRRDFPFYWPFDWSENNDNPANFYQEAFEAGKRRLAWQLVYLNSAILILAGAAGYFLAGRTLKPIALMLEEQKRFVADASHELRTPLTAMKSEIEVALRDKNLKVDEARELLGSNLEEVDKLKSLTDYFLALNKYQDDGLKTGYEEFNLKQVLEEIILRFSNQIKDKEIEIKQNFLDLVIKANRVSVAELFSVLLDNAIKYSKRSGVVEILILRENRWAVVKIKDYGVGIKEADLPHIFERFYRGDESRNKEETKGYGLGLSIAQNIVDRHLGKIKAESVHGAGSTFTVWLPIG